MPKVINVDLTHTYQLGGFERHVMKRLFIILVSLISASAFGDSSGVTAHLDVVSVTGTHTNLTFTCNITLDNQTGATLIATNLFCMPPGLALRVTDLDGHELAQTYALPWEIWQFHIRSGSYTFSNLWYGQDMIRHVFGLSTPVSTKAVRLQIVGTLSGSSYTNRLTSNVVEVYAVFYDAA